MKKNKSKGKKRLNLPRAPLPRQTGGAHRPDKGRGSYDRKADRLAVRKGEFD